MGHTRHEGEEGEGFPALLAVAAAALVLIAFLLVVESARHMPALQSLLDRTPLDEVTYRDVVGW